MAEIKYEVTKELGILSENPSGWSRQVNLVSWNDREPKVDIRDWSPNHEKMSKGISLTNEEAIALRDILIAMELD